MVHSKIIFYLLQDGCMYIHMCLRVMAVPIGDNCRLSSSRVSGNALDLGVPRK